MPKRTKPKGAWQGTEEAFQVAAIRAVRYAVAPHGVPSIAVMHVPNGGKYAHPRIAAKMKQAGVVAGYPDIMVFSQSATQDTDVSCWGQFWCGLALELKVWPNKPQPTQVAVHGALADAGWMVRVCYGMDDVMDAVDEYFCNEAKTRTA